VAQRGSAVSNHEAWLNDADQREANDARNAVKCKFCKAPGEQTTYFIIFVANILVLIN